MVDIDLLGSFHVLRSAFQYLKKPGSSVINISAPQAFVPMPMQSHVCAAKAGVDMLTRTLALEVAMRGITVNAVAPGYVMTPMQRAEYSDEMLAEVNRKIPLNRHAEPAEIAATASGIAVGGAERSASRKMT